MKTVLLCLLSTTIASCLAADIDSMHDTVKLGSDAKGAFITTNGASMPFYIVTTNLDLSSLVGAKWDTNVVRNLRPGLITQFVPSVELVNGRIAPAGYLRFSGRYAVLNAQSVTLATFEIQVSDGSGTKDAKDEVLLARLDSLALKVDPEFLEKADKLRRKNPKSD